MSAVDVRRVSEGGSAGPDEGEGRVLSLPLSSAVVGLLRSRFLSPPRSLSLRRLPRSGDRDLDLDFDLDAERELRDRDLEREKLRLKRFLNLLLLGPLGL